MTNFEIQRADCILRPVQSTDTEAPKRPSTRTMSKKNKQYLKIDEVLED